MYCLPGTQGQTVCAHGLVQHPHIFSSFPFQMSPKQAQVLSPMVLLKPEHHSWGQHLPRAHTTHPGSLCRQPPSCFLKDPPKSPTPSHSAPEKSQDNSEHDGHVPQVRGGVSMKEGPEALAGGPPLSLSVVPALSAFRLRLPGRDTTPPLWRTCHPLTLSTGISHTPICPINVFLQQFRLLEISSMVGGSWHGRWRLEMETREGEGRKRRTQGVLWGPHCSPCPATEYVTQFPSVCPHPLSPGH